MEDKNLNVLEVVSVASQKKLEILEPALILILRLR